MKQALHHFLWSWWKIRYEFTLHTLAWISVAWTPANMLSGSSAPLLATWALLAAASYVGIFLDHLLCNPSEDDTAFWRTSPLTRGGMQWVHGMMILLLSVPVLVSGWILAVRLGTPAVTCLSYAAKMCFIAAAAAWYCARFASKRSHLLWLLPLVLLMIWTLTLPATRSTYAWISLALAAMLLLTAVSKRISRSYYSAGAFVVICALAFLATTPARRSLSKFDFGSIRRFSGHDTTGKPVTSLKLAADEYAPHSSYQIAVGYGVTADIPLEVNFEALLNRMGLPVTTKWYDPSLPPPPSMLVEQILDVTQQPLAIETNFPASHARVYLDNISMNQWQMELDICTAQTDESWLMSESGSLSHRLQDHLIRRVGVYFPNRECFVLSQPLTGAYYRSSLWQQAAFHTARIQLPIAEQIRGGPLSETDLATTQLVFITSLGRLIQRTEEPFKLQDITELANSKVELSPINVEQWNRYKPEKMLSELLASQLPLTSLSWKNVDKCVSLVRRPDLAKLHPDWFAAVRKENPNAESLPQSARSLLASMTLQTVDGQILSHALKDAKPSDFASWKQAFVKFDHTTHFKQYEPLDDELWRMVDLANTAGLGSEPLIKHLWAKVSHRADLPDRFLLTAAKSGAIDAVDAYLRSSTLADGPNASLQPLFPEAPASWLAFPAWYSKTRPVLAWDDNLKQYRKAS